MRGDKLKLQKQISRIVGNKKYFSWVITIPPSDITELGWKEGDDLESVVDGDKLVIRQMTKPPAKREK